MKNLTVYHHRYLPLSETFIYRQLIGLSRYFHLSVITSKILNPSEYPEVKPSLIPSFISAGRSLGLERWYMQKQLRGASLLHVNFGNHALRMLPHAQRAGIPITAYFLGYDASSLLRHPDYCIKLRDASFAEVFVNSEDMKDRLTPYLSQDQKVSVVYCGIPLDLFPFRPRYRIPAGATFLQVSRLVEKKGVAVSIMAFHRYYRECDPSSRLVIAGDGPLREELQQLVTELKLEGQVTFLGSIGYRQYVELLDSSDILLHPSVTAADGDMEGVPTVICEAMACGLPVVATRHSGIPEAVEHGVTGFLATEGDADELFEKLLLLKSACIYDLSVRGRAKVEERFDHNVTTSVLAKYMHALVA